MTERPFFASRLFFLEKTVELHIENLSRGDFANFGEHLLCIRRETI